jgi:hypothetical protein
MTVRGLEATTTQKYDFPFLNEINSGFNYAIQLRYHQMGMNAFIWFVVSTVSTVSIAPTLFSSGCNKIPPRIFIKKGGSFEQHNY